MRPLYETKDNRKKESETVSVVCNKWGCKAQKTPNLFPFDYLLTRGDKASFAEIKNRTFEHTKYETIYICLSKINKCVFHAEMSGVPFFLILGYMDGIFYTSLSKEVLPDFRIEMNGRTDRNDPQDISPVYHIPLKIFKRIS